MNSIQLDLINLLDEIPPLSKSEREEFFRSIDEKILNLIQNNPIGSLSSYSIKTIDKTMRNRKIESTMWNTYKRIDKYIRLENGTEKQLNLGKLKNTINKLGNKILNKDLIKLIYSSKEENLIDFFCQKFSLPDSSIFGETHQTPLLMEHELEGCSLLCAFEKSNLHDPELGKKIKYVQRHIRRKIREDSEITRIGKRYFLNSPERESKAQHMIEEANTPYRPQKCSTELANRILRSASLIQLYHSVTHLLSTDNVAKILESCLYGRENLENFDIPFRPAALLNSDKENGDKNVICMGPHRIDPMCLYGRTLGLEFDLSMLKNKEKFNKNPAMFFKQCDLGYNVGPQFLTIKHTNFKFNHTGSIRNQSENKAVFQIYHAVTNETNYYAEVDKDILISYNIEEMDKILILNFFRFLDNLKTAYRREAIEKINSIYKEIALLDDKELSEFLLQMGKKLSCSSEFNFYGAYEIDLNALKSITIYEDILITKIEMSDLHSELKEGKDDLLKVLKEYVPEIFDSKKFTEFLYGKK